MGSGVSFSVVAHAPSGAFISGYRWRHGTTILKTGPDSSLAIAAATSSDAGTYTVEVLGSNGNTISPDATLSVVSGAWAPLAGRAVSSDLTSQQPALSLCGDTPKLAWIKTKKGREFWDKNRIRLPIAEFKHDSPAGMEKRRGLGGDTGLPSSMPATRTA
jgi:hypothetical protein